MLTHSLRNERKPHKAAIIKYVIQAWLEPRVSMLQLNQRLGYWLFR